MSIERPMVTLVAVTVKGVMGLESEMIRLVRQIRYYRYSRERNSGHWLERREREKKDAVVSITSEVSLPQKNLRLFWVVLNLKPLQNVWEKRCKTQVRIQDLIKVESKPFVNSVVKSLCNLYLSHVSR